MSSSAGSVRVRPALLSVLPISRRTTTCAHATTQMTKAVPMAQLGIIHTLHLLRGRMRGTEAPVGIEPTNRGFADLCLTTWLRRREKRKVATHYEFGKSWRSKRLTGITRGGNDGGRAMGSSSPRR